jgi:hypothetical protein
MAVVVGTDSYATEAELLAYATARGITISGDQTQLLIRAMDFLENQRFIGYKAASDQALQWPRTGVMIDGWDIDSTVTPNKVKVAQMEVALSMDADSDPMAVTDPDVKSQTVGTISITYQDKSQTKRPKIDTALNGLVESGIKVVIL